MKNLAFTVKKSIKKVLILIEKILPAKVYNKFYRSIFPIYKIVVRLLYKPKGILYRFLGNDKGSKMINDIYRVMPYTLVGTGGLEATYSLAKLINEKRVVGNFVELGVAKGGCAALMAGVAFEANELNREMWLFDSFEGLPDPTAKDFLNDRTGVHVSPLVKGSCLGTLEEVQSLLLDRFHYPKDKIHFVKGWFQDTLPLRGKCIGKIAILRIDGDWYESTKCCLEYLYDQVVPGGAVIIDDYQSCYGCKKAVDEFIEKRNISIDVTLDGRGGCHFIKAS